MDFLIDDDDDFDDDDFDDDDLMVDVDNLIYEPDEQPENSSKFVLGLCEQLNTVLHGPLSDNSSENCISDKFLTIFRFKPTQIEVLNTFSKKYRDFRMKIYDDNDDHNIHPIITYDNLNLSQIKPEIISVYYENDYCLATIKTIWIKIIQRAWKKIYAKRNQIMRTPAALMYRQLHGVWPKMPRLVGMLSGLSR